MIKAIVFDIGNVLLTGLLGVEKLLEQELGIDKKDIYRELHGENWNLFKKGIISEDAYIDMFSKNLGLKENREVIKRAIRENFREIEGTRAIIENLKEKYFVCALSNHGREWINYCEKKYKIKNLFKFIVFSYDVGLAKPEPRIYEIALERLRKKGIKPKESVFIDDQEKNLNPAQKLGLKTILFKTPEQLKKELRALNVNI